METKLAVSLYNRYHTADYIIVHWLGNDNKYYYIVLNQLDKKLVYNSGKNGYYMSHNCRKVLQEAERLGYFTDSQNVQHGAYHVNAEAVISCNGHNLGDRAETYFCKLLNGIQDTDKTPWYDHKSDDCITAEGVRIELKGWCGRWASRKSIEQFL